MKRDRSYTINLTEEEAEIVEKLAKKARRKPREMLYLIIADYLDDHKAKNTSTEYYDSEGVYHLEIK